MFKLISIISEIKVYEAHLLDVVTLGRQRQEDHHKIKVKFGLHREL